MMLLKHFYFGVLQTSDHTYATFKAFFALTLIALSKARFSLLKKNLKPLFHVQLPKNEVAKSSSTAGTKYSILC